MRQRATGSWGSQTKGISPAKEALTISNDLQDASLPTVALPCPQTRLYRSTKWYTNLQVPPRRLGSEFSTCPRTSKVTGYLRYSLHKALHLLNPTHLPNSPSSLLKAEEFRFQEGGQLELMNVTRSPKAYPGARPTQITPRKTLLPPRKSCFKSPTLVMVAGEFDRLESSNLTTRARSDMEWSGFLTHDL